MRAICAASGLQMQDVIIGPYDQILMSDNESILARGDVLVQWCNTCGVYPHILICGGYDSSGRATFYAHNPAWDNQPWYNNNTAHPGHSISEKVIHLSGLSQSIPTPVSITWNDSPTHPTQISTAEPSAVLSSRLTVSPLSYTVSQIGISLYNASGAKIAGTSEPAPSDSIYGQQTIIDMWYDPVNELGCPLVAGIQYQ